MHPSLTAALLSKLAIAIGLWLTSWIQRQKAWIPSLKRKT